MAASSLDQKRLSGQGLAPHLPSAQASARTSPPQLQPLYDFTFSLSPPFPGCQEPTGSCDVTNRLPALRKCWRIYGVHGAGEDKCILDADLSAQTSEPQPRRLTPCTPAACCQCGNEKFGGNGTPREFTPPTRTKVFSTGVSVIVMHEDVSQCSAALDTHTSTCWGAAGGQGWAHVAPRRLAGLPAELGCPQCMCSLLFHLWGSLSAKEHLHVCSALS